MKTLVLNDRARVGTWVAQRVGRSTPWTDEGAIGLEQDGELVAGIVLAECVPGVRASMHCAGDGKTWLNRAFLFAVFDYAFNMMRVRVLINKVSCNNEASLRFTKHIGFTEIARIPEAWDGKNEMVLFTMHRAQCRWLDLLGGRNAGT